MSDCGYEWDGIRFRPATGGAGIIIEPSEGSGELPCTFITKQAATAQLRSVEELIGEIERVTPESFLATFLDEMVADPLREALGRLRGANP